MTITKSITLSGLRSYGSILVTGPRGILINIDPGDARRTVRIRDLDINGLFIGSHAIVIHQNSAPGTSVVIENTVIDGENGAGIADFRDNGGKLVVSDTVIRHVTDVGIAIVGKGKVNAMLSNVRVHNAGACALLVNRGATALVSDSVLSGSKLGVCADESAEINIDNSSVSHNLLGLKTAAGGGAGPGVIRLSNSEISHNATLADGTVLSFSNNEFVANGAGGAINTIGVATSPTGQQ